MGKNKETLFVIFLLFLATFGIAATNYHPGTSLTGWDDLHSEFNLIGNILRSINFVWQDYEAMGTFIGVNDGADLPRLIYLWFLSLALPVSLIRYTFHFSMLLIGSVGTYFVIKTFFIDKHEKIKDFAALSGALFYLLNLGTLQYFATPFEPFSTFWGFFPWLIFGVFNYLYNPKRSNLFIFAFLNILAMPIFFLQTIFYVYLLILLFIFGTYFITHKTKIVFKTIIVAFSIFISVNAFWLLPHIYWFASSHSVQQEASMNRLTTEDTYQKVQQFGDLSSFMLFKNKPWDYRDFINSDQIFLLQSWHNYFENPYIPAIGYLIFIISILGIITLKSNRIFVIGLTVISFLILANQVPIAREFNLLFRQIGIVNQVLRDPFTKFIVPTIFVFAVGFSAGIILLYKLIPSKIIKPVSYIGGVIVIMMLVVYAWPIYTGHFFADRMRITTPQYYFDFFNFMRQQDPSKRIANLPQGPVWGWTNYSWGYTGSGFLWHGFNQSILDRTFDVWNDKNEEYYWELTYALNKRDYELFNSVLNKYQISYVMFDSSIYFPDQSSSAFTIIRQKEFIDQDPSLRKIKTFGTIYLYETNISHTKYVSVVNDASTISTNTNWLQNDKGYINYGSYISDKSIDSQVYYPFRSLFSGRGSEDIRYKIDQSQNRFIFNSSVPDGRIFFPENNNEEFTSFSVNNLKGTIKIPEIINNGKFIKLASNSAIEKGNLEIILNKDNRYGSYDSNLISNQFIGEKADCDDKTVVGPKQLIQTVLSNGEDKFIRFSSSNAITCRIIYLPEMPQKNGYLVAIKNRNQTGNSLRFWVENITEKRSNPQIFLKKQASFDWEYYIIAPMVIDGLGYTLHFDNTAIGKQQSINDLMQVIVYPIPYNFLTGIKIVKDNNPSVSSNASGLINSVTHKTSTSYNVVLDSEKISKNSTLVLSQSYDAGWKAYVVDNWFTKTFPVFGKPLKQHELINSWENGWDLSDLKNQNGEVTIAIIFWPQYLEFFGFVLLPVPFIYALWPRKNKREEV